MVAFFNSVLNFLIRDLSYGVRITISIILFLCAVFCFMHAVRVKNEKAPLSVGWLTVCLLSLFISALYMFL